MRGNAGNRNEGESRLPCAGITLIRFYGYNLSLTFKLLFKSFWSNTPGTLATNLSQEIIAVAKLRDKNSSLHCNFYTMVFVPY